MINETLFYFTTSLVMLIFSICLSAQNDYRPTITDPGNAEIRQLTKEVDPEGWLYFKEGADVSPSELLTARKSLLGLTTTDSYQQVEKTDDDDGYSHIRYQQFYNGIEVEGAQFTEHTFNDKVKIAHGNIVELNDRISTVPSIIAAEALNLAIKEIGATRYDWEIVPFAIDTSANQNFTEDLTLPVPILVISPRKSGLKGFQDHYLAWKVKVTTILPNYNVLNVYIDAKSGKIVEVDSRIRTHSTQAALDYGYGTRTIDTRYHTPFFPTPAYHSLTAEDNGHNVETKRHDGSGTFNTTARQKQFYANQSYNWGIGRRDETTAHWSVLNAYEYFQTEHSRDGWDDAGQKAKTWTDHPAAVALGSVFYSDGHMVFGQLTASGGTSDWTSLDIVAHEFTHGIIDDLDILEYEREPGALNESFADIFGVLAEDFAGIRPFNWQIGEDVFIFGGLRDMENPNLGEGLPQPSVYEGANWQFPTTAPPDASNDNHGGTQKQWGSKPMVQFTYGWRLPEWNNGSGNRSQLRRKDCL